MLGLRVENIGIDSMHRADLSCFCDALGSLFGIEIRRIEGLMKLNADLTMRTHSFPT